MLNAFEVCCSCNQLTTFKKKKQHKVKIVVFIYFQIKQFEKLETDEERISKGRRIYDHFIMKELLSQAHVSTEELGLFLFLADINISAS